MIPSHHFIQKAKTSSFEEYGYNVVNRGSNISIEIAETGEISEANIGDSPLVWFLMGVIMERHRAEKMAPKTPRKKSSVKTTSV